MPSGVCVAFPSISGRADSLGMGERRDLHERLLNLPRDTSFVFSLVAVHHGEDNYLLIISEAPKIFNPLRSTE